MNGNLQSPDPFVSTNSRPSTGAGWFGLAGLFLIGTVVDALCRYHPADLPYVMPWEFSWPVFVATFVTLGWFGRGLRRLPADQRLSWWRIASFVIGVAADYAVMQTHVDYLAQHMFFIHRAAHFVLLYPAPMLIALSASGNVVRAGMPDFLKPLIEAHVVRRGFDFMQRPVIAPLLFVGLIYLWLIPQIHTRAMLDSNFHDAMDWSIAIGAIVFWSLMLDRRPRPPASISFQARLAVILLVLLPQVALGAILLWSAADVYPIYAICGRIFAMTALDDQHYGGLIIALPSTVMCIVAMCVVLTARRRSRMPDVVRRTSA
jgi:putative membrane protein